MAEFDAFAQVYHTAPVMKRARNVARRYGLRGADTVHLASALWLDANVLSQVDGLTLITSDRELVEASEHAGLDVYDPAREPLPEP